VYLSSLREVVAMGNLSLQYVIQLFVFSNLGFGVKGGLSKGGPVLLRHMICLDTMW
jgi:hypothetical protein